MIASDNLWSESGLHRFLESRSRCEMDRCTILSFTMHHVTAKISRYGYLGQYSAFISLEIFSFRFEFAMSLVHIIFSFYRNCGGRILDGTESSNFSVASFFVSIVMGLLLSTATLIVLFPWCRHRRKRTSKSSGSSANIPKQLPMIFTSLCFLWANSPDVCASVVKIPADLCMSKVFQISKNVPSILLRVINKLFWHH